MTIDNETDLKGLLAAGRLVGETLQAMAAEVRPGVTTAELDALARERSGQTVLLRTADAAGGMRAFAERRRPEFRGE